jgi:PH domain
VRGKNKLKKHEWKSRTMELQQSELVVRSNKGKAQVSIPTETITGVTYYETEHHIFSFCVQHTKGDKTKTLKVACDSKENMALWMVMIDGINMTSFNSSKSLIPEDEKDVLMSFLYKDNQRGGVVRSDDGICYEYSFSGEFVRSVEAGPHADEEGDDAPAMKYVWDGYELVPKHADTPNHGMGVWNGGRLWWLEHSNSSDDAKCFLQFRYNDTDREYESPNPNMNWKWEGHFFTGAQAVSGSVEGSTRSWSVDGEVPMPLVMMAQCLEYFRAAN